MRFLRSAFAEARSLETKTTPVERAGGTATFLATWGQPYQSPKNLERMVKDGFEKVIWVYKSIDAIAGHAMLLPIVQRKGDPIKGKIVDPVDARQKSVYTRLNIRPNTYESSEVFRYRASAQLLMSKQGVFIEKVMANDGTYAEFHLLPPHMTAPIPDKKKFVSGFRVTNSGGGWEDIPAERVLWIKKPHPTDPYLASTPMDAAGLSIDLDFYGRIYNRNFLMADARPGGVLVVKGEMEQADVTELRQRFAGGPQSAGRTSVISAEDAVWVDTAVNPRDAQYAQLRNITKEDILMGFGVGETVIGNASGRTFDNADAEFEIFWLVAMTQHLSLLNSGWDSLATTDDDDFYLVHDTSSITVLGRAQRALEDHNLALANKGLITYDEARERSGLEPFDRPETKCLWLPQGTTPVAPDDETEQAMNEIAARYQQSQMGALGGGQDPNAQDQGYQPGATYDPSLGAQPDQAAIGPPDPIALPPAAGDAGPKGKALANGAVKNAPPSNAADVTANAVPTGVMVALYVPEEIRPAIAVEGGVDPSFLHMTLAYLGKVDDLEDGDLQAAQLAVENWADQCPPIDATVNSSSMFRSGDEVLLIDCPALPSQRERLVQVLEAAGLSVSREHGFTPHVSRCYGGASDEPVPDVDWTFDKVTLAVGPDIYEYELGGDPNWLAPQESKALDAANDRRGRALLREQDLQGLESRLERALTTAVQRQSRVITEKLGGARLRKNTRHWSPQGTKAYEPERAFDETRWRNELVEVVTPFIEELFQPPPEKALTDGWRQTAVAKWVGRIVDAVIAWWKRVFGRVQQADDLGANVDELTKIVQDSVDEPELGVASSMVFGASNEIQLTESTAGGGFATGKEWLSMRDLKVRPSHRVADGQIVAIDEPFLVGHAMLEFPGDPLGPPEEVLNCRCLVEPVFDA